MTVLQCVVQQVGAFLNYARQLVAFDVVSGQAEMYRTVIVNPAKTYNTQRSNYLRMFIFFFKRELK